MTNPHQCFLPLIAHPYYGASAGPAGRWERVAYHDNDVSLRSDG